MSAPKHVVATFVVAATDFDLNLTVVGKGEVISDVGGMDCGYHVEGAVCTANFHTGTTVILTATAAPGASFVSWSGCTASSGNSCSVLMDAIKSVTATFTP